jgi:hypothetical protein
MGKLTEQTIIKTVEEMIHEGLEPQWIREEVECMFDQTFSDSEWEGITMQAFIRRAFSRPLPEA